MRLKDILFAVIVFLAGKGYSQTPCTTLGQNPSTAFPVCGTSTFSQNTVPLCGGRGIPTTCGNGAYQDVNPFWYRFNCYTSGTLGFVIDPINNNDDYDWVLFDITGRNADDVYSDIQLNVAENWSAAPGNTGASATATGLRHCAGGTPNFSSLPTLTAGREYLLMVSNWSASQQGYSLTFSGGSAVITDPLAPSIQSIRTDCGGKQVNVLFNKRIKCSSLAVNGSDFVISPANGTVIQANGFGCTSSFDMDSAIIVFNTPLPPGNYNLSVATGSDGNTLLDNCNTGIIPGNSLAFTVPARPPLPMATVDAITDCAPIRATLTFPEVIIGGSVDISDFVITGPSPVTVAWIVPTCTGTCETNGITIQFAAPVTVPGTYTIHMATGTDGNTITGRCNREIPVGATAQFTIPAYPPIPMGTVNISQCAPSSLTLDFADPIDCATIAANGSDFTVTGASAVAVTGATPVNCTNGVATGITLQFSSPIIVAGGYQVQVNTGSDGNTLAGQCRLVTAGSTAAFTMNAQPPLPMGTVTQPSCIPTWVTLTFAEPVNCNSIAADGSDFIITGPSPVTVISATPGACTNNETTSITVHVQSPILVTGNYQVQVVQGSDGNTLIGQCARRATPGSTAPFTLPALPPLPMGTVTPPPCAPNTLTITFPEPVHCTSIAADGSDFVITGPTGATIQSAWGPCNGNGGVNTITLQLTAPIVGSGTYQLQMRNGIDGNTLVGDCNRAITIGDRASFTIADVPPVAMDSLVPLACSPSSLRLIFDDPILCSSIAANGSDFIVTGPSAVAIASAAGSCDANGLTKQIDIQLSSPIVRGGTYRVQLIPGNDGNTLLSECLRATPAGQLSFTASDTVSARFQYQVQYDCETDVVTFSHDGRDNVNSWSWKINGAPAGTAQTFSRTFSSSSQNQVELAVSNGVCSATHNETIVLDNKVVALFDAPEMICPEDTAVFKDRSTGDIDTWLWTFGNGNTSTSPTPPAQMYLLTGTEMLYTVSLTVGNAICQTTISKPIKVLGSCFIAVPNAFTPNSDGKNDYLYPLNAFKADNLDFKVFNRWGQLVFHSKEWTKKWDGKINGILQATGVYIWTLSYTHRDTKVKYTLRGTTTLIN